MIIPVYLSLVVKGINNIVVKDGKIDFNYTLKLRIAKKGLDEKAVKTISSGLNLRINNILVPITPGGGAVAFQNYPDSPFLRYTIRNQLTVSFKVNLLETPFDYFKIPFEVELVDQTSDDGWNYVYNCHFNTVFPDSNMDIGEHSDNLAEFNIDYGDCFTTVERTKRKARDGSVLYEASTSAIFTLSVFRVPDAMIINLFVPLVLLVTLQYFVFFSEAGKIGKIGNSAGLLLAALAYLSVFRASIPVSPSFTLGDSYAMCVLLAVLWTVIDAFAFPLEAGETYTQNIMIAHYTLIGVVSLYPLWVLLRTILLYRSYRQLVYKVESENRN